MNNKFFISAATVLLAISLAGCGVQTTKKDVSENANKNSSPSTVQVTTNSSNNTNNDTTTQNPTNVTKESNSGMKTFGKVTYQIPSTYINEKLEMTNAVLYLMSATDKSSFKIVSEKTPANISLDAYIKSAISNTGFDYQSNRKFTENGLTWDEEVSINPKTYQKLNQRTIISGNTAYVFTYAASTAELYDQHLSEFNNIIKSVKVK